MRMMGMMDRYFFKRLRVVIECSAYSFSHFSFIVLLKTISILVHLI